MLDAQPVTPREPWKVSFSLGQVFAGCVLTGAIFMALIFLWLSFVVPAEVIESFDPPTTAARLALSFGGVGGVLFLVVGPSVAFGVGWLLRRVENQSLHVLAFAGAGAVVGFVIGLPLGADLAGALGPTIGASAALSRMIMSRWANV
jgi:hypothetical protein